MDYFTLHALAAEWDDALAGAVVEAAWSQTARELTVALDAPDGPTSLRVVCDPARPLLFRTPGTSRQRRNTADVLARANGRRVSRVRAGDRDRHLFLDLTDGSRIQIVLFGPRPNVYWTDAEGVVREAFLDEEAHVGEPAPAVRPAPVVDTAEAFAERWKTRKTLAQSVAAAVPLMPRALAAEAVRRAGLDPDGGPEGADLETLFRAVEKFREALASPAPHVYWRGPLAEAFALVPLAEAPEGWRAEAFETVEAALAVWSKRSLGQAAYDAAYRPLEKALATAAGRRQRSAEAMLTELAQPSRADGYETWGHLLMALEAGAGPGRESVTVDDIVGGTGDIEIPLDPARSAVENAERFYDKARRTRGARAAAEERWASVHAEAEALADLLARLRATTGLGELRALREAESEAFARVLGQRGGEGPTEPFRRIALPGGFEALVGKHARGNAHLTTKVASPHDLWLHARGVPGSHVVVRRAGRSTEVPPATVAAAARLAAWFSTAKTQSVVPVTVTERKYVRPIKGGPPGLVRVDREDVLDVTPAAP
ncbi:NFACT family protein [Rubrivirga sp. IMCC45206]|uniref:NFACT family protein n=1 Tax=Rubrivirga sp. IMCC45206 TaxID=3391614 RepID=UPI0039902693